MAAWAASAALRGCGGGRLVALWREGEIVSYGSRMAATRLARAYALWVELGLPGMAAFQLEIHNSEAAPAATDRLWVEKRERPRWPGASKPIWEPGKLWCGQKTVLAGRPARKLLIP